MSWKRIIGWSLAGLLIFLVVVAIGGYLYLRSKSFEHFALNEIAEKADAATGGRTSIGGLSFSLKTLTAHLYDITVRGTESQDQPPLLHADELTVGLKVDSILHHKVTLRELLIAHPVVHVEVNAQGKNNLPTAPPSQSSSNTSVFDLAVGHAQITNGEVDYNDRKTPLAADLYNLGTDIHFDSGTKGYTGELTYEKGRLQYANYEPLAHYLDLKFSATPDRLDVNTMTLRVGSSEVVLKAQVMNYSNPVADGEYRIRIHTQDFASLSPSVKPAGDVSLNGNLHYQKTGDQMLRDVSIKGSVASDIITALASGKKIDVRKLKGTYLLAGGNFQLSNLSLETLGGRVEASAAIKDLAGFSDSSVVATLNGISLREAQRIAGSQQVPEAKISGTVSGKVRAGWKGSISQLRAQSDLFVRAAASSTENPSAAEVPVNGEIHANYDGPRQTVQVRNTSVSIPSAKVTAEGSISDRSNLQLHLVANDLHQLVFLASSFGKSQASPPSISGSATMNAVVQGSLKKPVIAAQLNAQNLQVEGTSWRNATMALHAKPSGITVDSVSLVNATQGQVTLSADVGLRNWSYLDSNPIRARLQVRQIRLADIQKVAKQNYPVSGNLTADVNISGTQLQPSGSGSAQIANAEAYGEPVQTLAAKFHTDRGTIISTLEVAAPAGAIHGDVSFTPSSKSYSVNIQAPSVVVQKFRTVQEKNVPVSGTINALVTGEGTISDPQLQAKIAIPQLQVRQVSISQFAADAVVANHQAKLALSTEVSQASIRARADVSLEGDYQSDVVIDTGTIPLEPLMATYAPSVPQGFQGRTEFHATLKGPLKDKSRVVAHLSIPVFAASYQSLQIGIAHPIQADYADSVVTLQPAEIVGTDTSLRAQGKIPIGGNSSPSLTAQGSVNLAILQVVSPTLQSSGKLALDVRSSGKSINGQVQLQNVAMSTEDAPVGVSKLNGTLDIGDDKVQVTKMTAEVGGGQVSMGGSIAYRPSVQFDLAMQGKSVRLRYPEGLRSVLNTNLAFSGTTQASTLNGRVLIDNLSFTPDFDLAKFSDQFSTAGTVSQPGFADTVKLGISVQSQNLNAVSSQVSIAGQVALQVGGTAANPVITGRTTLNSGELFFRNVRYQLQRGVITFDDPNETHPVLNVSVNTIIEQYNLTLTLRGPLDKLTTSYVSDPPLATADIINLVARGKTIQEQDASSQSTDSMIASQVAGQLAGSVQKLAGISSLSIDPTLGGNSNPSARIAIQQRVTKNLLFMFSTDVSQPGSEIVQGDYQFNKRWSVSVQRDQLGGVSVDGRYHKQF